MDPILVVCMWFVWKVVRTSLFVYLTNVLSIMIVELNFDQRFDSRMT